MAVLNFDIKTVALPGGEEAKAVFLTGSIDASTNQTFEARLKDILSSGTRHALLVLTNVKYINSTGLGTIVKCVDQFREKGGDIKLVGVPSKVIALFDMLGLLALFETYDTIEAAVASVGKKKAEAAPAPAAATKFPLQFKHPVTGMGLNVAQPGRFRDPRSGDYFSVDASGTVEFYQMTKVKVVEAKLPCDVDSGDALAGLAASLATTVGLGSSAAASMQAGLRKVGAAMRGKAAPADTVQVLMVAEPERIQVGLVCSGAALAFAAADPLLGDLRGAMSEVKHVALAKGHLLALTRKA